MLVVFCDGTNKSDSDNINEECSIFNVKTLRCYDSLILNQVALQHSYCGGSGVGHILDVY